MWTLVASGRLRLGRTQRRDLVALPRHRDASERQIIVLPPLVEVAMAPLASVPGPRF